MSGSDISGTVTSEVLLGGGTYGSPLIITKTGTVIVDQSTGYLGIVAFTGSNEVINEGTVFGAEAGIYIVSNTDVTNLGTIGEAVGETSALGIFLESSGFVENSGIIAGTSIGIVGFTAGESVTNYGTIFGGDAGIEFAHGGTIYNAGFISSIDANDGALELQVAPGASFGAGSSSVYAGTQYQNTLALMGGTVAGTLDMGGSFSGFEHISFTAGASWTLEGTTAELAAGETISGFTVGDTLVLEGFESTGFSYADDALVLSGGGTSVMLNLPGDYNMADFTVKNTANGTEILVCHLRGTRILTPGGEHAIEALRPGDEVVTRFGGTQRIKWIGEQHYGARFARTNQDMRPVTIAPGALGGGMPRRALSVSPGHSLLLGGILVLARDLVNGINITRPEISDDLHYYNIELAAHDCVLAEGVWSETYADCPGLRAKFHNHATFLALYPAAPAPPPRPLLCAPRPLAGPAFEAALAPILRHASGLARPGRLHGYVECHEGELKGWATDDACPDLPQKFGVAPICT